MEITSSTRMILSEEEQSEAQLSIFRTERAPLLDEVDILINQAEDKGDSSQKLREYRQALRDATTTMILPKLEDYI